MPSLVRGIDPAAPDLEGYLFPETYALPRRASADALVEQMAKRFLEVYDEGLRRDAAARGMTTRAVVTLASLIEKETSRAEERPLVSAVYHNRLRIGMGLQCDPTVIYALQRAGPLDRQPDPRGPAVRFALQHLSLRRPAARADCRAGPRLARGGGAPRRRDVSLLRQPQRRVARVRDDARRAQPERAGVPSQVFPRQARRRARRAGGTAGRDER